VRIRQIKPAWWLDKDLRLRLTADAREFYIGLWQLADDGGYLEWDVVRIAAELYPYGTGGSGLFDADVITQREAAVAAWAKQLLELDAGDPHLVIYDCGHARVPKMPGHQKLGGRPVYTVREAHARQCAPMRANAPAGKVGKGRERYQPIEEEGASEFAQRVARPA